MTLFLAGPTGSGKSAVAVELAEMLDAEIVSSDAYQVYRELPILTAAPSPADRERVPHHIWTVNSRSEIEQMALMGVDNIITDYPTRAKEVLYQPDVAKNLLTYIRQVMK